MNSKKAKAIRKMLKAQEAYINAPVATVDLYNVTNVQTFNIPGTDKVMTTCTRHVPPASRRGMYLAAKRKLA
jgi:hypothetical protein